MSNSTVPTSTAIPSCRGRGIGGSSSSPRRPARALMAARRGAVRASRATTCRSRPRGREAPDGRPRLPPGQRVLEKLKPMGGDEGDGDVAHVQAQGPRRGEDAVRARLRRAAQAAAGPEERRRPLRDRLVAARRAVEGRPDLDCSPRRPASRATRSHVIFEAAHGYTANVPLKEATADNAHGHLPPRRQAVRARSTARRCAASSPTSTSGRARSGSPACGSSSEDEPGYWEVRGYNNHADPWKEERYA